MDGRRVLYTFLDDGFDGDWGELPRHVVDRGRFASREDGTWTQVNIPTCRGEEVTTAGVFRVRIGDRPFTCAHVIDASAEAKETDTLVEAYLNRAGRTVLFRRYNGRQWGRGKNQGWADNPPWDEQFPDHNRLIIDDAVFVHWYDSLPDFACGVDMGARRPKRP